MFLVQVVPATVSDKWETLLGKSWLGSFKTCQEVVFEDLFQGGPTLAWVSFEISVSSSAHTFVLTPFKTFQVLVITRLEL